MKDTHMGSQFASFEGPSYTSSLSSVSNRSVLNEIDIYVKFTRAASALAIKGSLSHMWLKISPRFFRHSPGQSSPDSDVSQTPSLGPAPRPRGSCCHIPCASHQPASPAPVPAPTGRTDSLSPGLIPPWKHSFVSFRLALELFWLFYFWG